MTANVIVFQVSISFYSAGTHFAVLPVKINLGIIGVHNISNVSTPAFLSINRVAVQIMNINY